MTSIEELQAELEKEKQLARGKERYKEDREERIKLKAQILALRQQREHPHLVRFARGIKHFVSASGESIAAKTRVTEQRKIKPSKSPKKSSMKSELDWIMDM